MHTEQRVCVVSAKILDDITGVAVPVRHAAISLDAVHQSTTGVLESQSWTAIRLCKKDETGIRTIAVIVIHLR